MLLLRPLPFANPEQLVWIANRETGGLSGQTLQSATFSICASGPKREARWRAILRLTVLARKSSPAEWASQSV